MKKPLTLDAFSIAVDGNAFQPDQIRPFQEWDIWLPEQVVNPWRGVNHLAIDWHRDKGKDWVSARYLSWITYVLLHLPGDVSLTLGACPGTGVDIVSVHPNQDSAKNFHRNYLTPIFESKLFEQWNIEICRQSVILPKMLTFRTVPATNPDLAGRNIFAWAINNPELCPNNAETVRTILKSSAESRFGDRWLGLETYGA